MMYINVSMTYVEALLEQAGYDPKDQHFKGTDERWKSVILEEFPNRPFDSELLSPEFENDFNGMVSETHIEFSSLCAHHLMPFVGVAHVGYLPNKKVIGISKLSRLVEHFTHRITIQEEATVQIMKALEALKPKGSVVVLEGQHGCMTARGIRRPGAKLVTTEMSGAFLENKHGCRNEFFANIARGK